MGPGTWFSWAHAKTRPEAERGRSKGREKDARTDREGGEVGSLLCGGLRALDETVPLDAAEGSTRAVDAAAATATAAPALAQQLLLLLLLRAPCVALGEYPPPGSSLSEVRPLVNDLVSMSRR